MNNDVARMKLCREQKKEIERLQEHSLNLANELCEADLEIERMQPIIKAARQYKQNQTFGRAAVLFDLIDNYDREDK